MGWASGSYLAQDLYAKIRGFIPEEHRREVATEMYEAFCEGDADAWDNDAALIRDAGLCACCWTLDCPNCDEWCEQCGSCEHCCAESLAYWKKRTAEGAPPTYESYCRCGHFPREDAPTETEET